MAGTHKGPVLLRGTTSPVLRSTPCFVVVHYLGQVGFLASVTLSPTHPHHPPITFPNGHLSTTSHAPCEHARSYLVIPPSKCSSTGTPPKKLDPIKKRESQRSQHNHRNFGLEGTSRSHPGQPPALRQDQVNVQRPLWRKNLDSRSIVSVVNYRRC